VRLSPQRLKPSSICSAANVLVINCTGKIAANQRSSSTNRSNDILAKFPLIVHRLMSMRAAGCWTHKCVSLSPLQVDVIVASPCSPDLVQHHQILYQIEQCHPGLVQHPRASSDLVQHRTTSSLVEVAQMGSTSTGMVRLGPLVWGLLAFLIGYAIVRRTRTWLRLRHIPGPPFAGISELWLLFKTLGGRCHLDTAEACTKYGA
jgi:hypothetical protein